MPDGEAPANFLTRSRVSARADPITVRAFGPAAAWVSMRRETVGSEPPARPRPARPAASGWRGARDVMSDFHETQLALSQSFRFGSALAEEANRWLHVVDSPISLIGTPATNTRLERVPEPDAILCRSNIGAMLEVMHSLEEGRRVALVGRARPCAPSPEPPGTSKPTKRPP